MFKLKFHCKIVWDSSFSLWYDGYLRIFCLKNSKRVQVLIIVVPPVKGNFSNLHRRMWSLASKKLVTHLTPLCPFFIAFFQLFCLFYFLTSENRLYAWAYRSMPSYATERCWIYLPEITGSRHNAGVRFTII